MADGGIPEEDGCMSGSPGLEVMAILKESAERLKVFSDKLQLRNERDDAQRIAQDLQAHHEGAWQSTCQELQWKTQQSLRELLKTTQLNAEATNAKARQMEESLNCIQLERNQLQADLQLNEDQARINHSAAAVLQLQLQQQQERAEALAKLEHQRQHEHEKELASAQADVRTMAALLKSSKAEMLKMRDTSNAERAALSKQLNDLRHQLSAAHASGGQQLTALQQEAVDLRLQAGTAQATSDRLLEQLKRADETDASLKVELQAAKRQLAAAQLDHEVILAEHEKTLKDQADRRLQTATSLLRTELAKSGAALAQEQGARLQTEKQMLREQKALAQAEHQLRDKENFVDQALASARSDHLIQLKQWENKLADSSGQLQQLQITHQNLQHQVEQQSLAVEQQSDQEALKGKHDDELQMLAAQHDSACKALLVNHKEYLLDQQKQAELNLAEKLQEAQHKAAADAAALWAQSQQEQKSALDKQSRAHQEKLQHQIQLQQQEHTQAMSSQAHRYQEEMKQKLAGFEAAANDKQKLLCQQHADEIVRLKLEHQTSVATRQKEAAASHSRAMAALVARHQKQAESLSEQLAESSAQLTSTKQHALELTQTQAELQRQHSTLLAARDAAVQAAEALRQSHEAKLAQLHVEHRASLKQMQQQIAEDLLQQQAENETRLKHLRDQHEGRLRDFEQQYNTLKEKYLARESRQEDVAKIADLHVRSVEVERQAGHSDSLVGLTIRAGLWSSSPLAARHAAAPSNRNRCRGRR
ncbi:hypothetical protein WJX74_010923 [Apatococcus lobatus]|uniref:Uncharacterized protein n=1 Tax=Apatococcus lobatus TaxID=904363 RepID=A0AAW1SFQ0_9CHLO